MVLQKVPQVKPNGTGLSQDYLNRWPQISWLPHGEETEFIARHYIPIPKYREVFPPDQFEGVVTEETRSRIERLDELVDLANSRFADPASFTFPDYRAVHEEVYQLVRGYVRPARLFTIMRRSKKT